MYYIISLIWNSSQNVYMKSYCFLSFNKRSFGKFKHKIFCNNLKLTIFIINKILSFRFCFSKINTEYTTKNFNIIEFIIYCTLGMKRSLLCLFYKFDYFCFIIFGSKMYTFTTFYINTAVPITKLLYCHFVNCFYSFIIIFWGSYCSIRLIRFTLWLINFSFQTQTLPSLLGSLFPFICNLSNFWKTFYYSKLPIVNRNIFI